MWYIRWRKRCKKINLWQKKFKLSAFWLSYLVCSDVCSEVMVTVIEWKCVVRGASCRSPKDKLPKYELLTTDCHSVKCLSHDAAVQVVVKCSLTVWCYTQYDLHQICGCGGLSHFANSSSGLTVRDASAQHQSAPRHTVVIVVWWGRDCIVVCFRSRSGYGMTTDSVLWCTLYTGQCTTNLLTYPIKRPTQSHIVLSSLYVQPPMGYHRNEIRHSQNCQLLIHCGYWTGHPGKRIREWSCALMVRLAAELISQSHVPYYDVMASAENWLVTVNTEEQPVYLRSLIATSLPSCSLSWNRRITLSVPRIKTNTGARAFSSCAPSLWNNLPLSVPPSEDVSNIPFRLGLSPPPPHRHRCAQWPVHVTE